MHAGRRCRAPVLARAEGAATGGLTAPTFEPEDRFWVSSRTVDATERIELGDLLVLHARAQIELRIAPGLLDLWERVVASTLDYSWIRLRNAAAV